MKFQQAPKVKSEMNGYKLKNMKKLGKQGCVFTITQKVNYSDLSVLQHLQFLLR